MNPRSGTSVVARGGPKLHLLIFTDMQVQNPADEDPLLEWLSDWEARVCAFVIAFLENFVYKRL